MNIFLTSALIVNIHRETANIRLSVIVTLNFLRRNTYCCSKEAKNIAYLSLVRPHLEYPASAAAWDPYMAKDIQQLERVQHHITSHGENGSRPLYLRNNDKVHFILHKILYYNTVRGSESPKSTISPFSPCDIIHIYIIAVSIKDIAYCNPFMTSWTSPNLSIKFSLYSFTV